MPALILPFENPVERALKKACIMLTILYDNGHCPDDMYFTLIEELDRVIQNKRRIL